jgi:hypothetical protein
VKREEMFEEPKPRREEERNQNKSPGNKDQFILDFRRRFV